MADGLQKAVGVLTLTQDGNTWRWAVTHPTWAAVELTAAKNLFSQVALGARTAVLTMRKQALGLQNAIRCDGKTLCVTQIDEGPDRHHLTVTTAMLEPVEVTLHRETRGRDALNRPKVEAAADYSFPAWLTEKYVGRSMQDPAVAVETTYVLIVLKGVTELRAGETVQIGHKAFTVLLAHVLDPDRNEYEIYRSDEA